MKNLGDLRKLAAIFTENCEDYLRSNLAEISNVPRSQKVYITQVSEQIEGRVTMKLHEEFSRTENPILGALSHFDDFLKDPLNQCHSGTTLETSRKAFGSNQGTNEDDYQSDSHREAGVFQSRNKHNSGLEDGHDMVTTVHE